MKSIKYSLFIACLIFASFITESGRAEGVRIRKVMFKGVVGAVAYLSSDSCLRFGDGPIAQDDNMKACLHGTAIQNSFDSLFENFSSRFQCSILELPTESQDDDQIYHIGWRSVSFAKFMTYSCLFNPAQDSLLWTPLEVNINSSGFAGNQWSNGLAACHSRDCDVMIGGEPSYSGKLPGEKNLPTRIFHPGFNLN